MPPVSQCSSTTATSACQVNVQGAARAPACKSVSQMIVGQDTSWRAGSSSVLPDRGELGRDRRRGAVRRDIGVAAPPATGEESGRSLVRISIVAVIRGGKKSSVSGIDEVS